MYELNCGPRTAYNRAVIVSQLLKANGITKLLSNRDWPDYVEPIRSIYEPEEIEALLKACDNDERVLYLCYLLTGLRDKEMRYLIWRDIDFRTQVIRVTRKPLYGFKPKNKEEREVPVPASLLSALKNLFRELRAESVSFLTDSARGLVRDQGKENEKSGNSFCYRTEASQASDVGSIPIARFINPDDSVDLTRLSY